MLRVVSWNINGIRSPLQGLSCQESSNCPTALRRILDKLDADIVCLQETKVTSKYSRIHDLYRVFFLLTFAPCSTSFHFVVYSCLESCPYTHLKVRIPFLLKTATPAGAPISHSWPTFLVETLTHSSRPF